MIGKIQNYFNSKYSELTFGQIQDTPDYLLNMNVVNSGKTPFFNNNTTTLIINIFVRDTSFETMQNKNEEIINDLIEVYDVLLSDVHIITTTFKGSSEPYRDNKNRYYQTTTFEMLIEERR